MPLNESRNAIEFLKHDHREVESLFAELEASDDDARKLELGRTICTELLVHTQIEEELFYPAARDALPGERRDMIAEATVEHGSLKRLIAEIDGSGPGEELFDARLKVLKEYVQHHVREEEQELMPAVERTEVDLDALGTELAERKQALKQDIERMPRPRSGTRTIAVPKRAAATSARGAQRRTAARPARGGAAKKAARKATAKKSGAKKAAARKGAAGKSHAAKPKRAAARKHAAPTKSSSTRKRAQARRSRAGRG